MLAQLIPVSLALGCTILFYTKTILTIRSYPPQLKNAVKTTMKLLALYPIIQTVILGPYITVLVLRSFKEEAGMLDWIPHIIIGLAGTINCILYLSQMKNLVQEETKDYESKQSFL